MNFQHSLHLCVFVSNFFLHKSTMNSQISLNVFHTSNINYNYLYKSQIYRYKTQIMLSWTNGTSFYKCSLLNYKSKRLKFQSFQLHSFPLLHLYIMTKSISRFYDALFNLFFCFKPQQKFIYLSNYMFNPCNWLQPDPLTTIKNWLPLYDILNYQ